MSTPSLSFEEWNKQQAVETDGGNKNTESTETAEALVNLAVTAVQAVADRLGYGAVLDAVLPVLLNDDDCGAVEQAAQILIRADSETVVQTVIACHPHNRDHPLVKALGDEAGIVEWIAEEYTADDWRAMHSDGECKCVDSDSLLSSLENARDAINEAISIVENT